MLTVSVIIPAFRASKTLAGTLESIRANTIQPKEIIIIDGLSNDGTEDIAKDYNCQLFLNPSKHTAAATQVGIYASQGDIIAMTNADCLTDENWLERLLRHFELDPDLDGVGGPVRLEFPLSRVQAYLARKAIEGIPENAEIITRKGMRGRFSGANCAYRRQLLLNINGVDLRFKTHGSDIDLFWRAVDHQARLLFDPEISVVHLGFAQDYSSLIRKSFGYGLGSARLAKSHFPKKKFDPSFYWKPLLNTVRELRKTQQNSYPECVLLDQSFFAIGRTWGLINKQDFR